MIFIVKLTYACKYINFLSHDLFITIFGIWPHQNISSYLRFWIKTQLKQMVLCLYFVRKHACPRMLCTQ